MGDLVKRSMVSMEKPDVQQKNPGQIKKDVNFENKARLLFLGRRDRNKTLVDVPGTPNNHL